MSQSEKAAVYLSTLGCRLNEAELVSWSMALEERGHVVVRRVQDANLIVLNTCAVTSEASRKSRKLVGSLHRKNPNARLVLTGCMAQMEPTRAAELTGVDLVLSNHDKDQLVEIMLKTLDLEAMPALAQEELHHPYTKDEQETPGSLLQLVKRGHSRTRAFIKVQDGCRNKCSYCVVTLARGDERSRSVLSLVEEINKLHAKGHQEMVLTGVHLGGYGHDINTNLSSLVQSLLAHTSMPRLRLSSLEPWDLPPDFSDLWQDKRLLPHLHLPLQSGSDSVLRRMSRRCFRKEYRELVTQLRANIPHLNITSDIIVGFPGESEAEFEESLSFVEEIGFGHMHIFGFSAREGTRAASLPHRIPGDVIRERSRRMHRLAAKLKESFMQRYLGEVHTVLWEGKVCDDGTRQGYTNNYMRVVAKVKAEITQSEVRLESLEGTPVERFGGVVVS